MSHRFQILIVDDDEAVRDTLALALELEGYRAATAENGKAAIEKLNGGVLPFLIICDLMMPVMNGWEFIHVIKSDPQWRAIPVAVMTAFAEKPKPAEAQALIRKPIDMDYLVQLVKQHCGQPLAE